MIVSKNNPNSPVLGLQLSSQDTGCCPPAIGSLCQYRFLFASLPTTFSSITLVLPTGSTTLTFNHTYSTPLALRTALYNLLISPVVDGGAGLVFGNNDFVVYMDTFAVGGSKLVMEFNNSAIEFVNVVTNLGTLTDTLLCTKENLCLYRSEYTDNDPIAINIDGKEYTLATYGSSAALRTAVQAQITAQGHGAIAIAKVRDKVGSATVEDLWLYVKVGVPVYVNGTLLSRVSCGMVYIS